MLTNTNCTMEIGQIVYSKSGRDKGKSFIVYKSEFLNGFEYAYLIDGETRKVDKPKRKKAKHIQITNKVHNDIKHKIVNQAYLTDSDVRKALYE